MCVVSSLDVSSNGIEGDDRESVVMTRRLSGVVLSVVCVLLLADVVHRNDGMCGNGLERGT